MSTATFVQLAELAGHRANGIGIMVAICDPAPELSDSNGRHSDWRRRSGALLTRSQHELIQRPSGASGALVSLDAFRRVRLPSGQRRRDSLTFTPRSNVRLQHTAATTTSTTKSRGHDEVTKIVGLVARKLARLKQLHSVKR